MNNLDSMNTGNMENTGAEERQQLNGDEEKMVTGGGITLPTFDPVGPELPTKKKCMCCGYFTEYHGPAECICCGAQNWNYLYPDGTWAYER